MSTTNAVLDADHESNTSTNNQPQDNSLWNALSQYVSVIDKCSSFVLNKINLVDKLKIVMYVSWLWAWAGLYTTKLFERIFMAILYMPDNWLALPIGKVENTFGQKIQILSAHTNHGEITNKLKLFLKFYWEKGGLDMSHDENGVDFMNINKLLNCTVLYCSYLLTDKDGNVPPEVFWNNVHKFLVEQQINPKTGKATYLRSHREDRSDSQLLPMRNLDFDGSKQQ